ncbi:hypothetical protein B0T14DRAFT_604200 [Immersiella caudata]|uniref:Uncharacterized protein n=1 Tax=Immersiella caudata TaxID=314043 RepID=A0AA40C0B6_9PEZI|nr:hypothetical protein B0T14DRAFT_604200 [Immersiella caudata]
MEATMATNPPEPPPIPTLETLPLLVLDRICECLHHDWQDPNRGSLHAFALASKTCYEAAARQLFSQIHLHTPNKDALQASLERWAAILGPAGFHRHVRRLKVTCTPLNNDPDEWVDLQNRVFDMDDFFQPHGGHPNSVMTKFTPIASGNAIWVQLAEFIDTLSGLKDLVWAYSHCFPKPILASVLERGKLRLHMDYFRPESLTQDPDALCTVDPDDYALMSSPSLYGISGILSPFNGAGYRVNYIEEAIREMLTQTSPNLTHVNLTVGGLDELFPPTRPPWKGFFLDETDASDGTGSLQSLAIKASAHDEVPNLAKWFSFTDPSKLRRLTIPWYSNDNNSILIYTTLVNMACARAFLSLDTLNLTDINDGSAIGQALLCQFVKCLPPLSQLSLEGQISLITFETIICRHGDSLRTISIRQDRTVSYSPIVTTPTMVKQMAAACRNLEELKMGICRTYGDEDEVAIYHALSKFPRLKKIYLRLEYNIGPDQDSWDDELDGDHPIALFNSSDDIPLKWVRDAFINGAIDATLASSIADIISPPDGPAKTIYLEMAPHYGKWRLHGEKRSWYTLNELLAWFSLTWIFKRNIRGQPSLRELHGHFTTVAGGKWERLANIEKNGQKGCELSTQRMRLFHDIWGPPKTERWWED